MRAMTPNDGVAWITGASSGIGRGVALEMARRGWRVVISARRITELEAVAAEANGLAGTIIPLAVDVTNEAAMEEAVSGIEAAHGPIALAFLNAGIAPYVRAPQLDVAAIRQVFDVNVMGVVHGLGPLLPLMAARGKGQIAVNASVAGYGGLPKSAAYGGTKAALINMCEALKFDCDPLGIRLQLVNPGFVETPLTDQNDFPMPFLISGDVAAKKCVDGFEAGSFEINFPRRLAYILKLVNLLPYPLYFWLVGKTTKAKP